MWRTAELTSFVGREVALRNAEALLSRTRLLTMVGPGGVGKTRLAVEVARRIPQDQSIAYLAEVDTPDALHREVIRAAGIVDQTSKPTTDVLVEHLRDRRQLLILDNCEHLWNDVGELVDILLVEAPGVRVMATSRRGLELAGEHVLRVEPLSVQPARQDCGGALSEAMRLLVDRTAAAGRSVDPTDPTLRQLVEWSGGLPLVLELMAVRLAGGLSPHSILERLDGGRLLTASAGSRQVQAHHRTLQQTLDWSYDLCSEDERRLWARSSVFVGGFTLAAAEQVCSDEVHIPPDRMIDLLDGLVRQSLVTSTACGRYQQLQPVREYGRRRLRELGEEFALKAAHAEYFQRWAEESAQRPRGIEEANRLEQASRDLPNFRAALNFCAHTPDHAQTGLAIATDLTRSNISFYYSLLGEFCDWLERFLVLTPATAASARINGMVMLGWIRLNQGDLTRAKVQLDQCRDLAREVGAPELPGIHFIDGVYRLLLHGALESVELLGKARDLFAAAGPAFRGDRSMAGLIQAVAAGLVADEQTCTELATRIAAEAEDEDAAWTATWARWVTGLVTLRFGDPVVATRHFQRALTAQLEMRDKFASVWTTEGTSWSLAAEAASGTAQDARNIAEWAAELQGGAQQLQHTTGIMINGLRPFRVQHNLARNRLLELLGPDGYHAAHQRGVALSMPDAYRLALRPRDPNAPRNRDLTLEGLSERQRQIAELVAEGLRNQQIADKLVVSVRTVEHHLSSILTKLGASNRVQLAGWVAEQHRANEQP